MGGAETGNDIGVSAGGTIGSGDSVGTVSSRTIVLALAAVSEASADLCDSEASEKTEEAEDEDEDDAADFGFLLEPDALLFFGAGSGFGGMILLRKASMGSFLMSPS